LPENKSQSEERLWIARPHKKQLAKLKL
jgi:hypothetical protein